MALESVIVSVTPAPPRRAVRLTGTDHCPRWRGRVHLAALTATPPAGAALLVHRPTPATAVYVLGMVALYAVSSGYHLLPLRPAARRAMRLADHATIYVFIAASYTPLCRAALPGAGGTALLVAAWAGAAIGVVLKVTQFDRRPRVGSIGYLALGWMVVPALPDLAAHLGALQLVLIAGTGLAYTLGAGVLFARWPDPVPDRFGYHELWHLAVVVASACYFAVIWTLPAVR